MTDEKEDFVEHQVAVPEEDITNATEVRRICTELHAAYLTMVSARKENERAQCEYARRSDSLKKLLTSGDYTMGDVLYVSGETAIVAAEDGFRIAKYHGHPTRGLRLK